MFRFALILLVTASCLAEEASGAPPQSLLRAPLPPEELHLTRSRTEWAIEGPTFSYRVQRKTGAVAGIRVARGKEEVISSDGPVGVAIDELQLCRSPSAVSVLHAGKDKIVIQAKGTFQNNAWQQLDFTMLQTFFNDGVVVVGMKLVPRQDFEVHQAIAWQVPASGAFSSYLHKRRDEHGEAAARGKLPTTGAVRFSTLTSCLSVVSPAAALAIFTDSGAAHLSRPNVDTAIAEVTPRGVVLSQSIVRIAPGDKPLVLKAGEEFAFRTGISVAPNRLPNPRTPELRMFIWIGDAKYPYPADEEITKVAQWGYTMFQLHRDGTPGEPRPPAAELERVIRKVHEFGMLYLQEENADLLYDSAPGVQALKAEGNWNRWQGFNYGGRYQATMDPYCDLTATCLASPNGLAEYRLANISRMLDRFAVDGIYLDDNLAYPNCTLWKEHGHPRPVYDCLIELHEINWRRRELLRQRVPHAVLVSHNTKGFVLPVIADFDVQYFAEGYCFESLQDYWDNYRAWSLSMGAQAMICPGDDEGVRCNAALACNYDLLTGGGQYSQMDWRLFPGKFHYAGGVSAAEVDYCRTYNLAAHYFGLSEAKPWYFADSTNVFSTSTPLTYASIYQHKQDWLIPLANMDSKPQTTSLIFHAPGLLGMDPGKHYLLFDVHQRKAGRVRADGLNAAFSAVRIPGQNLQLYALRSQSAEVPAHLWGGKRLSETWQTKRRKLTLTLHGPVGVQDTVLVWAGNYGVEKVLADGKESNFSLDSHQKVAHGMITFTGRPLKLEVFCCERNENKLTEASTTPDVLGQLNPAPK
jgi:hypothetical protein